MKWYIPKEHGAWAMVIVPYWLGASVSGLHWMHILFFIGIFSFYFSQAPLLTFIRNRRKKDVWPSFFVYITIGSIFLIPFFLYRPQLFLIGKVIAPLFFINIIFAKLKKERLFINDFIAICGLSSLLLLAYRLTEPAIQYEAFLYLSFTILFFTASVFHVKSLIREKNNVRFKKASIFYHVAIVLFALFFQWYGAAIAFVTSLFKTTLIRKKYLQKPIQIGIIEIINSCIFFVVLMISHYWMT